MTQIETLIQSIHTYQNKHTDLKACHHFTFDLRVNAVGAKPTVAVIGMNPGEVKADWRDFPTSIPLEETSARDFRVGQKRSTSSKKWLNNIDFYIDGKPATTTEFFHWSTPTTGKIFTKRFGHKFGDSPHLDFCAKLNIALLKAHDIKLAVCPGLGSINFAEKRYNLRQVYTLRDKKNGHRLVEHFESPSGTWLFTKHWSGARGLTTAQKKEIKSYILEHL